MKKARVYTSSRVGEILAETSELEKRKLINKMYLASKIADAMSAKGWNNNKLMEMMERNSPSIISRWLSGTHNFTTDTLSELEEVLEIKLLDLEEREVEKV